MRSRRSAGRAIRIGLFGMAPDTGNMGVSALCHAFLAQMHSQLPGFMPIIFDNATGVRANSLCVGEHDLPVTLCGARGGHRYYRPDNLSTLSVLSGLGRLSRVNPVVRLLDSCDVVMDASAGDSFSDIYGQARFQNICQPKFIACRRSRPLLLLPQTYGPFRSEKNVGVAKRAILGSRQAWARDAGSLKVLQDLLGNDFDPSRHQQGVDLAFGLPVIAPSGQVHKGLMAWLDGPRPVVGINVSGLVWHQTTQGDNRFGFKADYRAVVRRLVEWLLEETDARVLLVPHVHAPRGSAESDLDAIEALIAASEPVSSASGDRIAIADEGLNEQESKWMIGQCDWFCGTRMHATIAGLSSGVPTATVVYSDKAEGVFACCDQQDQVVDPRRLTTDDAVEHLVRCFLQRKSAKARLDTALETVMSTLDSQMCMISRFAMESV